MLGGCWHVKASRVEAMVMVAKDAVKVGRLVGLLAGGHGRLLSTSTLGRSASCVQSRLS